LCVKVIGIVQDNWHRSVFFYRYSLLKVGRASGMWGPKSQRCHIFTAVSMTPLCRVQLSQISLQKKSVLNFSWRYSKKRKLEAIFEKALRAQVKNLKSRARVPLTEDSDSRKTQQKILKWTKLQRKCLHGNKTKEIVFLCNK
jgi:hypothetical protein